METIQSAAGRWVWKLDNGTIIICARHYFYNINTGAQYEREHLANTYLSMAEYDIDDLHIISSYNFGKVLKQFRAIIAQKDIPMQIMLVHDNNLMTDDKKYKSPQKAMIPWADFNIDSDTIRMGDE